MSSLRLILCTALTACSHALHLTAENFDENIFTEDDRISLITFATSWSDDWVELNTEWEQLKQRYDGHPTVTLAVVLCEDASMEPTDSYSLCERFGIEEYPTVKLFQSIQPDSKGETLGSSKDMDKLRKYLNAFKPECSAATWDSCTADEKARVEVIAKPQIPLEQMETVLQMMQDDVAQKLAAFRIAKGSNAKKEQELYAQYVTASKKAKLVGTAVDLRKMREGEEKEEPMTVVVTEKVTKVDEAEADNLTATCSSDAAATCSRDAAPYSQ